MLVTRWRTVDADQAMTALLLTTVAMVTILAPLAGVRRTLTDAIDALVVSGAGCLVVTGKRVVIRPACQVGACAFLEQGWTQIKRALQTPLQ